MGAGLADEEGLDAYRQALTNWGDDEIRQAIASRSRCNLCPSFRDDLGVGFVRVRNRGPAKPKMLIVGEAPGQEESRLGYAFVGQAAQHGDKLLKAGGVDLSQCTYANIINCFPRKEGTRSPRPPEPQEILNCFPYLLEFIDEVRPEVILTFGATATHALIGKRSAGTIAQAQGEAFEVSIRGRTYRVVASYHPAADLRSFGKYASSITKAAAKAWGSISGIEIDVVSHVLNDTEECIAYLDSVIAKYDAGEIPYMAYDLEWASRMEAAGSQGEDDRATDFDLYDPKVDLCAVSIATDSTHGYTLMLDHVESKVDVPRVKEKLKEVLSQVPVIAHGAQKAEIPWSREKLGIVPAVVHDTMLLSYACWMKTESHGLKILCQRLFGWPDWSMATDAWFNSQPDPEKRTFKHIPLEMMSKYAPVDACGCFRACEVLIEKVQDLGVGVGYKRRMRLMKVLVGWEQRGNFVDLAALESLRGSYPKKVAASLEKIREIPEVKAYETETGKAFNPRSSIQLVEVLYGECGAPLGAMNPPVNYNGGSPYVTMPELEAGATSIMGMVSLGKHGARGWIGRMGGEVGAERIEVECEEANGLKLKNPLKSAHVGSSLIRGTPCVDEDQLLRLQRQLRCPICFLKDEDFKCEVCLGTKVRSGGMTHWKSAQELVSEVHRIRKISLIVSNYLEKIPRYMFPGTNRITTNYLLHTVATGRLSTKDMNIHSFPWGSDIRRLFVSKWYDQGGLYAGVDYSQIEIRTLAALSGDKELLEAYLKCPACGKVGNNTDKGKCSSCGGKLGLDLHSITARVIFGLPEGVEVEKAKRTISKSVTFGMIYGRGARAISEETGVSIEDAEQIVENFFAKYKGVKQYFKERHAVCVKYGECISETGTRLVFSNPDAVKEYREYVNKKNWAKGDDDTTPKPSHDVMRQVADAKRQSQNFVIQGPAGELTIDAIIELDRVLKSKGLRSHAWETTHDSIGLDLYPSAHEIFSTLEAIRAVMEEFVAEQHPWMTVPILVDRTIGARWDGEMEIIEMDGDQMRLKGPKEYFEQILQQLEKAELTHQVEVIKEWDDKKTEEITQKGYAGGSGRVDRIETILRLGG